MSQRVRVEISVAWFRRLLADHPEARLISHLTDLYTEYIPQTEPEDIRVELLSSQEEVKPIARHAGDPIMADDFTHWVEQITRKVNNYAARILELELALGVESGFKGDEYRDKLELAKVRWDLCGKRLADLEILVCKLRSRIEGEEES